MVGSNERKMAVPTTSYSYAYRHSKIPSLKIVLILGLFWLTTMSHGYPTHPPLSKACQTEGLLAPDLLTLQCMEGYGKRGACCETCIQCGPGFKKRKVSGLDPCFWDCEVCPDGRYSSLIDNYLCIQCYTEETCDKQLHRHISSNCTKERDAECGSCKEGYVIDPAATHNCMEDPEFHLPTPVDPDEDIRNSRDENQEPVISKDWMTGTVLGSVAFGAVILAIISYFIYKVCNRGDQEGKITKDEDAALITASAHDTPKEQRTSKTETGTETGTSIMPEDRENLKNEMNEVEEYSMQFGVSSDKKNDNLALPVISDKQSEPITQVVDDTNTVDNESGTENIGAYGNVLGASNTSDDTILQQPNIIQIDNSIEVNDITVAEEEEEEEEVDAEILTTNDEFVVEHVEPVKGDESSNEGNSSAISTSSSQATICDDVSSLPRDSGYTTEASVDNFIPELKLAQEDNEQTFKKAMEVADGKVFSNIPRLLQNELVVKLDGKYGRLLEDTHIDLGVRCGLSQSRALYAKNTRDVMGFLFADMTPVTLFLTALKGMQRNDAIHLFYQQMTGTYTWDMQE